MLETRRHSKITKKLKNEKTRDDTDTVFREEMLRRMDEQEKTFNETMGGLQRNMQVFNETMSNAFSLMANIFNSPSRENLYSQSRNTYYIPEGSFYHTRQQFHSSPTFPQERNDRAFSGTVSPQNNSLEKDE